jgi:hypothetical protein
MGTSIPAVRVTRGVGGAIAAALVALALVALPGPRASAADLSATSDNGLNVSGAATASGGCECGELMVEWLARLGVSKPEIWHVVEPLGTAEQLA